MSNNNHQNKNDIVNLHMRVVEFDSRDKDASREFISSGGINPDKLIAEGLKKIKRMQMLAMAKRTEQEMAASESVKFEAIEWVDRLLNNVDFSLTELIQKEELILSFRNVESLSPLDIRDILVQHFILKFMNQHK